MIIDNIKLKRCEHFILLSCISALYGILSLPAADIFYIDIPFTSTEITMEEIW